MLLGDPNNNETPNAPEKARVELTDLDRLELYAFLEGRGRESYRVLGAHGAGEGKVRVLVYAPKAQGV